MQMAVRVCRAEPAFKGISKSALMWCLSNIKSVPRRFMTISEMQINFQFLFNAIQQLEKKTNNDYQLLVSCHR
jgi:hypothetical protein